eukprot:7077551-Alexandrium_andersonii.AAC.1
MDDSPRGKGWTPGWTHSAEPHSGPLAATSQWAPYHGRQCFGTATLGSRAVVAEIALQRQYRWCGAR